MSPPDEAAVPSLFEWAGGAPAFDALIDRFYDRVEHDDLLSPLFPGGVSAAHRDHVSAWWQEVFGGPTRYDDELGGYPAMVDKHRGLGITAEQRRRFVDLMSRGGLQAGTPHWPNTPPT